MSLTNIIHNLPEVKGPTEKRLSFNVKLKWTLIVLISFFVLANISIYGGTPEGLKRFEYLAVILGTDFGSIISLGIGPIVMSSIILQLLVGAGILNIDTSTKEGKRFFQAIQKLGVFFFIIFEAIVYVLMGGIEALPGFELIVITQLILGGILILFMDEVCQKWGFGSGVSLFIMAGVGWRLFTGLFGFIGPEGSIQAIGSVLVLIQGLALGDASGMQTALGAGITILSTAIIFLIVVWAQSLKIEIPLSYDRVRGYGVKWPLSFFYASVIPVILTGALVANLQLFGGLIQDKVGHPTILGNFVNGQAVCQSDGCGLAFWLSSTQLVNLIVTSSQIKIIYLWQTITHILFYVFFSVLFSLFWIKTSGTDAQGQAKNIISSGLQLPGFRKDPRILEAVLNRYIIPLTVMGGMAIGLLAAVSNVLGAITGGTSILLGIMITFQFYQNISQQHAMDMHPALKKFMS